MGRRGKKKGRPISGWLVLDKPVGMGSTEAVSSPGLTFTQLTSTSTLSRST